MAIQTTNYYTGTTASGTYLGTSSTSAIITQSPEWVAGYDWSNTGRKCSRIMEPEKSDISWLGSFYTEEEAWDYFNKRLMEHVNFLIKEVKYISKNKALEKRLIKYNNNKGLQALRQFQHIVDSIPEVQ